MELTQLEQEVVELIRGAAKNGEEKGLVPCLVGMVVVVQSPAEYSTYRGFAATTEFRKEEGKRDEMLAVLGLVRRSAGRMIDEKEDRIDEIWSEQEE